MLHPSKKFGLYRHRAARVRFGFALAVLALAACAEADGTKSPASGAFDPHNLDGVWDYESGGKFGPEVMHAGYKFQLYPFTPAYQKIYDKRIADAEAGNPYQTAGTTCLPSGMPRMLTSGGPLVEFFHTPTKILILKENGGWARIYLNRGHLSADDLTPLFYGDSVGHWEGNTLVVDTISLGGADNIDGQAPHSDAAHMVQRIRLLSPARMEVKVTLDDPKALLHPISTTVIRKLLPDYEIQEQYCTNERNVVDSSGNEAVKFGAARP